MDDDEMEELFIRRIKVSFWGCAGAGVAIGLYLGATLTLAYGEGGWWVAFVLAAALVLAFLACLRWLRRTSPLR